MRSTLTSCLRTCMLTLSRSSATKDSRSNLKGVRPTFNSNDSPGECNATVGKHFPCTRLNAIPRNLPLRVKNSSCLELTRPQPMMSPVPSERDLAEGSRSKRTAWAVWFLLAVEALLAVGPVVTIALRLLAGEAHEGEGTIHDTDGNRCGAMQRG